MAWTPYMLRKMGFDMKTADFMDIAAQSYPRSSTGQYPLLQEHALIQDWVAATAQLAHRKRIVEGNFVSPNDAATWIELLADYLPVCTVHPLARQRSDRRSHTLHSALS
jgi:hypothetical protein